jgi:nitrite reductase/ring-hydroxylating ferredoxin subunit
MVLVKVADVNDIKDGESKVVSANGELIALYKAKGNFFATTNECPHKGGPLGEGYLEGEVVTCPWHGWKFNVCTGISPVAPTVGIKTYNVTVQGNNVMIEI